MRYLKLCAAGAFVFLTIPLGSAAAAGRYPMSPIPQAVTTTKTGCIPCKAKCMKCVPPKGRGIFESRDACLADCDKRGNKLLNTTCGITGAASRAGCS